jgi:FkbM family methyltransferase
VRRGLPGCSVLTRASPQVRYSVLGEIYGTAKRYFRAYVLNDKFERTAARWFRHRGDETLRLDYRLTSDSIVFDCGGYEGDWTAAIFERYGCTVFVFEPVERYARSLEARFGDHERIRIFRFGLHSRNERCKIHLAANASSVFGVSADVEEIQLRDVQEVLADLDVPRIDLMKVNIEGGEFDLLDRLLATRLIARVDNLQVQFHRFVPNAVERRERIREKLAETHQLAYDYEFVWESWRRRLVRPIE